MLGQILGGIVAGGIQAATQGGPRRQYKWNKKAATDANEMNRANQQWLLEQQKAIQAEQRAYDSPQAQMSRYIEAGLNPHLIYGNGSSAGQAFAFNPAGVPAVNIQAPNASYPNPVPSFLGASQALTGMGLTEAKTEESVMKRALIEAQTQVQKANPMLDPRVLKAISDSMIAVAEDKAKTIGEIWKVREITGDGYWYRTSVGAAKVSAQLDQLGQKFQLNNADLKIRNKILESKEFENALKELQVNWMKDGEITPQHIYQGLLLLLGKLF